MPAVRDVNYSFRVVGQMPERGNRGSVIKDAVGELRRRVHEGELEAGEKSTSILADYKNRTAAAAQLNVIRHTLGREEASGLRGVVSQDDDPNSDTFGRFFLFMSYDPTLVTDAGAEKHAAAHAARTAHVKELAAKKKAEKAAAPKAAKASK